LEDLCGADLLGESIVALGFALGKFSLPLGEFSLTLGKLTFEIGYPYIKPSSSRINPNFYHHLTGFVASICYKGFQWVVPG